MRKYLILSIIMLVVLSGCGIGSFIMPNDTEFITVMNNFRTPKEIVNYMAENFEYEYHPLINLNPYKLWLGGKGDCDDMYRFAALAGELNNIEVYKLVVMFNICYGHAFAVYREGDMYSFSSNYSYYEPEYISFKDIVEYFFDTEWKNYKVYDYSNNLIENGVR